MLGKVQMFGKKAKKQQKNTQKDRKLEPAPLCPQRRRDKLVYP